VKAAGVAFAFVHGSRVDGRHRPDSDLDVAAYWTSDPPQAFELDRPDGVDPLVLNHAPLEIAGRIAMTGRLLLDDDQVARVRWVATTRKIYLDELPRIERSHREFLARFTDGG
jgi:predicted nucleotidyltransferase